MRRKIEKIDDAVYERNYVYNCHYHLVWVTKYRRQVFITPELVQEMKDILKEIARLEDVQIDEMEVMPDHVHMLISFKPKYAATDLIKSLKGHSALRFFASHPDLKAQKFWGGHLWSHSYYLGTFGNMSREVVEKYIRNQYKKEEQREP